MFAHAHLTKTVEGILALSRQCGGSLGLMLSGSKFLFAPEVLRGECTHIYRERSGCRRRAEQYVTLVSDEGLILEVDMFKSDRTYNVSG